MERIYSPNFLIDRFVFELKFFFFSHNIYIYYLARDSDQIDRYYTIHFFLSPYFLDKCSMFERIFPWLYPLRILIIPYMRDSYNVLNEIMLTLILEMFALHVAINTEQSKNRNLLIAASNEN